MTRGATAARFGLAYPVMDAAHRKYQAKLDAMIDDGLAEKVLKQASLPYWDMAGAAGQFGLSPQAGQYLAFAARNRTRAAQQAETNASETSADATPLYNKPA